MLEGVTRQGFEGMHRFEYKAYRRPFSRDWSTSRQVWSKREGILIRLEDKDGRPGYGEVAPIEAFGSESFVSALAVCSSLPESIEPSELLERLFGYPAMRFAVEAALAMIEFHKSAWPAVDKPWPVCGLFRDVQDEAELERLLEYGFQCLKAKVGVGDSLSEMRAIDRIMQKSDGKISLRLDANGAFTLRDTMKWLDFLADQPNIEYVEQPMAKGEEATMMRLAEDYPTPLALDESVCSLDDLKRWRDEQWPGIYVLKPLLSGAREELIDELQQGEIDVVYSSSLETMIGFANGLDIAIRCPSQQRALGYDTAKLFSDKNIGISLGPFLQKEDYPTIEMIEILWNQI